MEKIMFRILILRNSHACEGPSNALGLLGQLLLLWLGSLLAQQQAEIQAGGSSALSCYSTTLWSCSSEVSLSSVVAHPAATSEQASDHQTEAPTQKFKGLPMLAGYNNSKALLMCNFKLFVTTYAPSTAQCNWGWEGTQICCYYESKPS